MRSSIIHEIRSFFTMRGFLEVDTPILAESCIPESSIPLFKTLQLHPYEDPRVLQLLPSPEYYIKQLLADGWGDLFQMAKSFRNGENTGRIHSSEFTMLEYYAVEKDYLHSIRLTEELFSHIGETVRLPVRPPEGEFSRISMTEAFKQYADVDLAYFCGDNSPAPDEEDVKRASGICRSLGISVADGDDWESLFNRIFLNLVEPRLESHDRPLVLLDYPKKLQSLSKEVANSPWSQRWELYWQGVELANCFTEETDVSNIRRFFSHEMTAMGKAQSEELRSIADLQFHEKISGLPESSGTALGLDRLIMLLCGASSLREVMLFPLDRLE